MIAPLYDVIVGLAGDLVRASEKNNEQLAEENYECLLNLCNEHKSTEFDHPLQWEALGDFSTSLDDSVRAYNTGLECAERLGLTGYLASIRFALAEIYAERGDHEGAKQLCAEAKQHANDSDQADDALKAAIDEFLVELQAHQGASER